MSTATEIQIATSKRASTKNNREGERSGLRHSTSEASPSHSTDDSLMDSLFKVLLSLLKGVELLITGVAARYRWLNNSPNKSREEKIIDCVTKETYQLLKTPTRRPRVTA